MRSSSSSMSAPRGASCCFSSSPTTWCPPTWSGRPWRTVCSNSAALSPCRGASRQRRSARVPTSLLKPVLFFESDNTLMQGDILDEVIEKYSPNEAWRDWEDAWAKGHLPARDCLRLQVGNMRVSRERLLEDLTRVRIDPAFAEIVEWAKLRQVGIHIVSDSFVPLIRHILRSNGIAGIPIFANDLRFLANDRLPASFPFYDPASERSANARPRHLLPSSAIAREGLATGARLYDLGLSKGWMTREQLDEVLRPEVLTKPHFSTIHKQRA